MAGVDARSLIELTPAGGIDNVSIEASVGRSNVRAAVNVDIDDAGTARRRKGYALAAAALGLHSLYVPHNTSYMLAGSAAGLVKFSGSLEKETLASLARPGDPLYFDSSELLIYYSNGYEIGALYAESAFATTVSAPQPSGQPNVTVNPVVGGLDAGYYQVAITFFDAMLRESGSTLAVEVQVPEGGGIVLDDWPDMAGVDLVGIYMTPANGDMLYLAERVEPDTSPYLLGRRTLGKPLETQFLTPMPPCINLCMHLGRLYGSNGNIAVWSESLNHGLTRAATNWVSYNAPVSLIASGGKSAGSALFMAAGNRTYAMSGGDPSEWARRIVHPVGAVPGSLTYVMASDLDLEGVPGVVPVWQDTAGELIAGLADGSVLRLHKDAYAAPVNAAHGFTACVARDGMSQLVASAVGGAPNGIWATDVVEAVICRNGVVVG